MDTVTNVISPKSGSRQSPTQSTRLCQACLSVLARDDLEVERNYPHHGTLRAFVEASDMRCYVCSWVLSPLPENGQSILRLLAKGTNPHHMIVEEGKTTDPGASDPRAKLIDRLRKIIGARGESVSWVSFTTMRIEAPTDFEGYRKISAYLNPSYEGYFPLDWVFYDDFLKDYWIRLSINSLWTKKLIITSCEGESILTLTITRWNLADSA